MRRTTRNARATLAALLVVAAAAGPRANAQQTAWQLNISLGDWFIANNWTAGVPTAANSAIFGNSNPDGALITTPGAVSGNNATDVSNVKLKSGTALSP